MKTSVRVSMIAAACAAVSPLFLGAFRSPDATALDIRVASDTLMFGQMAQQALVVGQVTDAATGLPIEHASVRTDRGNLSATTATDGRYLLSGAPTGFIRITVQIPGYVTQVKRVQLFSSRFTKVDFSLAAVDGTSNGASNGAADDSSDETNSDGSSGGSL